MRALLPALAVAAVLSMTACGGGDDAVPAEASAATSSSAPSSTETVGDIVGTTPTPTAEEQAALVARLEETYPGLDEEAYVKESRNTCRDILTGEPDEVTLPRIAKRFVGEGLAEPTTEQAAAIKTAISETFCDAFE